MCHIDCFLDFLVCQTVFLENLEKNVDHREISLDSEIPLRKLHLSRTKLHPFPLPGHSVGRNPAPFDSLSMFIPSFTTGFIYPNGGKGLGISEPSTVRFPITCTEDRIFSSSKRRSRRRSAFYASWLLKDSSWKIVPQVTQVTNKYIHIIYTYMYVNIHIYIYWIGYRTWLNVCCTHRMLFHQWHVFNVGGSAHSGNPSKSKKSLTNGYICPKTA